MKVLEHTQDRLILEDTPWGLGIALIAFSLFFFGVGIAMWAAGEMTGVLFGFGGGAFIVLIMALLVRRVQVVFDRDAGAVAIRRRTAFGDERTSHQLQDVEHAVLESHRSYRDGRSSAAQRASLVLTGMSAGVYPLTKVYSTMRKDAQAVDIINTWLQNCKRTIANG